MGLRRVVLREWEVPQVAREEEKEGEEEMTYKGGGMEAVGVG